MPDTSDNQVPAIFVSVRDAARILAVSEWTVRDLIRVRAIEGVKAGSRVLVVAESLLTYANGLRAESA